MNVPWPSALIVAIFVIVLLDLLIDAQIIKVG